MTIENSKVIDLNVKKEDRVLDFSDFQKQDIKFDIEKLQEKIANKLGYRLMGHKLELYGVPLKKS